MWGGEVTCLIGIMMLQIIFKLSEFDKNIDLCCSVVWFKSFQKFSFLKLIKIFHEFSLMFCMLNLGFLLFTAV